LGAMELTTNINRLLIAIRKRGETQLEKYFPNMVGCFTFPGTYTTR